jgi:CO/xanthine dehydrogenase Mo-binding subunit
MMITMTMITISRTASKTASRERDVELEDEGEDWGLGRGIAWCVHPSEVAAPCGLFDGC